MNASELACFPIQRRRTEAARRTVDDVATAGNYELRCRRKVARSSGLGMEQRCIAVSALPSTARQCGAMSALSGASAACARSARHHSHLVVLADCAGIRSASQLKSSARPDHPKKRTGGRLLAARRARFISTVHDIQAASSLREYDLVARASFDRVRYGYRMPRSDMLWTAPTLVYLSLSHPLA